MDLSTKYVLSACVPPHKSDARAVCRVGEGFATASRDGTARIYVKRPNIDFDMRPMYEAIVEFQTISGKFINAISFIPDEEKTSSFDILSSLNNISTTNTTTSTTTASTTSSRVESSHGHKFAKGRFVAGGADKMIYVWRFDEEAVGMKEVLSQEELAPLHMLTGHNDVVCCICSTEDGEILSSSWDFLAKKWSKTGECITTFRGHSQSVWGVCELPKRNGEVITASADRTLRRWASNGKELQVYHGHTGAVRSVAVQAASNEEEYLLFSCGNDGVVLIWDIRGNILRSLVIESFLYSLVVMPDTGMLAIASEDRGICLVRGGTSVGNCEHPCTVWNVALVENGDIISGGSDGIVRIWTRDGSGREAPPEELVAHDSHLAKVDPSRVSNLDEALQEPGKKDGEHKLVNNRGNQEVFEWNAAENEWKKLGDVIKEEGNIINGKSYDMRFDIQVGEGGGTLPLGMNKGENAYTAAQRFIDQHDLDQDYLQEIAEFLMKNTQGYSLGGVGTGDENKPLAMNVPVLDLEKYFPPSTWFLFSKVGNRTGMVNAFSKLQAASFESVTVEDLVILERMIDFVSEVVGRIGTGGALSMGGEGEEGAHDADVEVMLEESMGLLDRFLGIDVDVSLRVPILDLIRLLLLVPQARRHWGEISATSNVVNGFSRPDTPIMSPSPSSISSPSRKLKSAFVVALIPVINSYLTYSLPHPVKLVAVRALCNAFTIDSFNYSILQSEDKVLCKFHEILVANERPSMAMCTAIASCYFNIFILHRQLDIGLGNLMESAERKTALHTNACSIAVSLLLFVNEVLTDHRLPIEACDPWISIALRVSVALYSSFSSSDGSFAKYSSQMNMQQVSSDLCDSINRRLDAMSGTGSNTLHACLQVLGVNAKILNAIVSQ